MTSTPKRDPDHGTSKVPANARPAIVAGLAILLVTFGGFGTWAALAPLAGAVIASGVLVVEGNRKSVQHPIGGVVRDLAVREGDRVAAGDVLLRLDPTEQQASLAILEGRLAAERVVEARLIAERDGAEEIAFPSDLNDSRVDGNLLADQQALFRARRASMAGEIAILEQRRTQLAQEVVGREAQQRAQVAQSESIDKELAGITALFEKGYVTKTRLYALERERARLDGEAGRLRADIARARTEMGETGLEIIQVRKNFREEVIAALRERRTQIADLRERVAAVNHVLSQTDLVAPVSGFVVGLEAHTVGGVIGGGQTVLQIVPDSAPMVVDAQIRPADIDAVTSGQPVNIKLTAFKQRQTPVIAGTVIHVSADRMEDERSGVPFYRAQIAIADGELDRLGSRRLQPGMPAEVMIKTQERTALAYVTQPFVDSVARAWREE